MKKYSVVEFSDGLALVPSVWLNDNETCIYPSHMKSQNRLNKAILEQQLPFEGEEWDEHSVIRVYGTSDSYENGMRKLQAAEETSNIDTDDGNNTESQERAKKNRRQKAKKQFSSSDENESDNELCSVLPPFPVSKLKQPGGISTPSLLKRVLDPEKKTFINDKPEFETPKRRRENETSINKGISSKAITTLPSPRNLHTQDSSPISENASRNEFRKLVLSKLNALLKRSERIEERITTLEQSRSNNDAGGSESEEDGIGLPLTNFGDLNNFEEKLKTDSNYFRKMVNVLKRIGGSDVNTITYGILKKLLSNSLAENFSWAGFKGKRSFKELRLTKLITKTVRIHKEAATDEVIVEPIAKWLAQAKLRASREVERNTKKNNICSVEQPENQNNLSDASESEDEDTSSISDDDESDDDDSD